MTGFTKGPWHLQVLDYSMAQIIPDENNYAHADMSPVVTFSTCESCEKRRRSTGWKWGACTTATEADALLMTAAPDMYEALEAFILSMDDLDIMPNLQAYDGAKAALAKARGEQ